MIQNQNAIEEAYIPARTSNAPYAEHQNTESVGDSNRNTEKKSLPYEHPNMMKTLSIGAYTGADPMSNEPDLLIRQTAGST